MSMKGREDFSSILRALLIQRSYCTGHLYFETFEKWCNVISRKKFNVLLYSLPSSNCLHLRPRRPLSDLSQNFFWYTLSARAQGQRSNNIQVFFQTFSLCRSPYSNETRLGIDDVQVLAVTGSASSDWDAVRYNSGCRNAASHRHAH